MENNNLAKQKKKFVQYISVATKTSFISYTAHLWKEHLVLRLTLELQAKGKSYKTKIVMK